MPITRQTGSFVAKQEDGKLVTLKVFTDYIVAESRERAEEIPGRKTLRTLEGHVVNRLNKGRYQVVVTGVRLTSDDPAAS